MLKTARLERKKSAKGRKGEKNLQWRHVKKRRTAMKKKFEKKRWENRNGRKKNN